MECGKTVSGAPGWLSLLGICLQLRSDLGILRWSPTSDSLRRGEPASPSAPLPAHALSLSQVKKKKFLKSVSYGYSGS